MTDYPLKTIAQLDLDEDGLAPTDLLPVFSGGGTKRTTWQAILLAIAAGVPVPTSVQAAIDDAIASLVDTAPGALDTLNELAAALGDDANFAATVTNALAGKQPIDAQLTALAALTGAAGSFVRWTGADSAVMQAIVGTVAQSAGVPTGAIIERGSNANGDYVRYADGTQICWANKGASVLTSSVEGGIYLSTANDFTFPASFTIDPIAVPISDGRNGGTGAVWAVNASGFPTKAQTRVFLVSDFSGGAGTPSYIAIGRWF